MVDAEKWKEMLDRNAEERRRVNNLLNPNKTEIRQSSELANSILKKVNYIELMSSLAHEEHMEFEKVQQIIDCQTDRIKDDIKYLIGYLNIKGITLE